VYREGDRARPKDSTLILTADSGCHLDSDSPSMVIQDHQFLAASETAETHESPVADFSSRALLCLSERREQGRKLPRLAAAQEQHGDLVCRPTPVGIHLRYSINCQGLAAG